MTKTSEGWRRAPFGHEGPDLEFPRAIRIALMAAFASAPRTACVARASASREAKDPFSITAGVKVEAVYS
jgi:hypothetical protein